MNACNPISRTKLWLENWVVALNLCPFARAPLQHKTIRFSLYEGKDEARLIERVLEECHILGAATRQEHETTLLIAPHCCADFEDYLSVLQVAEQVVSDTGWQGEIQLASFHPHYAFADVSQSASQNYSNRSPYPIFHLLREASISEARERMPDLSAIPQANVERLEAMGRDQLLALYHAAISA